MRAGVLGAAATTVPALLRARLAQALLGPAPLLDGLRPVLRDVSRDTLGGLVSFVVPGPDPYSQAQGVTTVEPGGVDADGIAFMHNALDNFFPLPDDVIRVIVQAFATGIEDSAGANDLFDVPVDVSDQLGDALEQVLASDETMPLSALIALMLNYLATVADPTSLNGPFPASPFANLSFDGKIEAFRTLEEDTATVVALVDSDLPEPMTRTLSGIFKFVAGALLEFPAFGAFSEWSAFDRSARTLTGVPVGWQLTGYLSETDFVPVNGWDEFIGYFEGREEVSG